jgi:cystathionine beta-synthase
MIGFIMEIENIRSQTPVRSGFTSHTLLDAIGNTPLVRVDFGTPPTILAKLEYLNPGGSIKDRAALFMIEEAERKGLLKPGGTIIEASSGNQGIAAAMIGVAKGYNVIITVSDKISDEKINTIRAYGAEVLIFPATEMLSHPASYHSQALALQKRTPNSFMLNQYHDPYATNSEAHYRLLGPEIWRQTHGSVTHCFAAAGSCGTITGLGRFFKEQKSKHVNVIGVDALNSYRSTHGDPKPYKLEGIGVDYDAPNLQKYQTTIDEFFCVSDEQGADMLKRMARNHAILCGPSSGAVAYAAYEYSKKLSPQDIVVMIIGDSGRAYLSKNYYL